MSRPDGGSDADARDYYARFYLLAAYDFSNACEEVIAAVESRRYHAAGSAAIKVFHYQSLPTGAVS